MPGPDDVVYHIDDKDEIVFVNFEYDEFALANDGVRAASAAVLGRPLWDFVVDATTQHIYRRAVHRVRDGRSVEFTFRCDSPARRRLMQMRMNPEDDGTVRFIVRTVATEDRPPQRLFLPDAERTAQVLVICGWCKKIRVGERWDEVDSALASLRTFEQAPVPELSHGICEECLDIALRMLDDA